MLKINRRKFVTNTAASAAGLMLGRGVMGFSSKKESPVLDTEEDLMGEVMKYRKIDSHAHVYIGF
jgi:hypothetical protein